MDLQEDFDEMNVEGEDMDEDGFGAGRRRGRRDTNRMVPKYMMMMVSSRKESRSWMERRVGRGEWVDAARR